MTPDEAADLAARTLAAIDAVQAHHDADPVVAHDQRDDLAADRERVESDLAGLRDHDGHAQHNLLCLWDRTCPDARRYADGLRRTARLYGVTP